MTDEFENLENLGAQLIETAEKLRQEAQERKLTQLENNLIIPESDNILSGFSWKIVNRKHERNEGVLSIADTKNDDRWAVQGKPIEEQAKSFVNSVDLFIKSATPNSFLKSAVRQPHTTVVPRFIHHRHPMWRKLEEKLKEIGGSYKLSLGIGKPPKLVWGLQFLVSTSELLNWIHTHSHLQFTNLSDTVSDLGVIIEKKEAECIPFKDLASSINNLHGSLQAEDNFAPSNHSYSQLFKEYHMNKENQRSIGNQLIEAGKQLLEEVNKKDEADILSVSKDILSEFSWTFVDLEESAEEWYLEGNPEGPQAESFLDLITTLKEPTCHIVWEKIRERLCEKGENHLYLDGIQLRLDIYTAKEFLDWLKAHSHFQFTNLPEAHEALAPIIEKRKIEQKNLEGIAAHLTTLYIGENPPVSFDAVDWEEVAKGNQEAPPLLNLKKVFGGVGSWIYVGYDNRLGTRRGWDDSTESRSPEDGGLSLHEAISRVHTGSGETVYWALYRHLGEGIAELVYSKNKKDETEYPISLDAVDWVEVAAGKQQAPKLLSIIGDKIDKRSEGDWIYVGPPEDLGNPHLGWDYSDSHPSASGGLEAISYMKNAPRYSALYRYRGEGIAELVASKHKS